MGDGRVSFSGEAVLRGYNAYKDIWAAVYGKELPCEREAGNRVDAFAVAVIMDNILLTYKYYIIHAIMKEWFEISNHSKGILSIQIEIWTTRKRFDYKFEPLESDLKCSNATSNHSKGIRSIRIQIWTTRKGFEVLECKFKPFEKDSNASNPNSNHSKEIRSIGMQIPTIRKGFEAFESKFKPLERGSKQSNEVSNLSKGTQALESKFKSDSNPNSNH